MTICDIDEPIWLTATFTDKLTGEPRGPDEIDKVVCTVLIPRSDEETATPEVDDSEAADGKYKARFLPGTHGKWEYAFDAFDADGEPVGREEDNFSARKRKVPRD
jgi:hypothetical protein